MALLLNTGASQTQTVPPTCQLCAKDPKAAASNAQPDIPLSIEIEAALDFSHVARQGNAGGSVRIDPTTGLRQVEGGLTDLGGGELRGQADVHGSPLRAIRIILPNRVTLTAADGSTAQVVNMSTNLPPNPRLGPQGDLHFSFAGQLLVGANGGGTYHGRIPIEVDYQ